MADVSHPSAEASNRSSIDYSLELERQLNSEDEPGSPHVNGPNYRTSLDPHVLAHIVTQLRDSLTNLTQERDDLIQQLAESHSRGAEFKDSVAFLTERCANLETELSNAKKKSQDDDEAISMLRSKVEESRRGLMRLQSERNAESKRMTLDLSQARTASFGGVPRSSHRASFTPLTGSGAPKLPSSLRRPSSTVNENDPGFAEFVANLPGSPGQILTYNESVELPASPGHNRRRSMFGSINRSSGGTEGRVSPSPAEIDALKRELTAAKAELDETRHELTESNEAREASETCVQALRDYITQLGTGDGSGPGANENVRLPPLPTDSYVKNIEVAPKPQRSLTGWSGLNKLWRVDTGVASSSSAASATATTTVGRSSMDTYRTVASDQEGASPSTAVPLRNKFGAFFARGTSISSTTHPPPELHQDEPILNGIGSDVSSLETSEPASPSVEKPRSIYFQEATEVNMGVKRKDQYSPDLLAESNEPPLKAVDL